jgi:uncharacterized protein (DUF1015 family)
VKISPICGLRLSLPYLNSVAAEPYDIPTPEVLHHLNPLSFLNISRASECDQDYERCRERFFSHIREGIYLMEREPTLYVYELSSALHTQTGFLGLIPTSEATGGRVLRHENTVARKEDERIHHLSIVGVDTGPVTVTYRAVAEIRAALEGEKQRPPLYDFSANDGSRHRIWRIRNYAEIVSLFSKVERTYVADGHHRLAAVEALSRRNAEQVYDHLLAAFFPHDELKILPYNRILLQAPQVGEESFFSSLRSQFNLVSTSDGQVQSQDEARLYRDGKWYSFSLPPDEELVVQKLGREVLRNHFGIEDERRDERIRFVPGSWQLLKEPVDLGAAWCAFSLPAVSIDDVMIRSDRGELMPPKATYFDPKVRTGIIVHHFHHDLCGGKF